MRKSITVADVLFVLSFPLCYLVFPVVAAKYHICGHQHSLDFYRVAWNGSFKTNFNGYLLLAMIGVVPACLFYLPFARYYRSEQRITEVSQGAKSVQRLCGVMATLCFALSLLSMWSSAWPWTADT